MTTPDRVLGPTVAAALRRVDSAVAASRVALLLEDFASQTHLAATPVLKAPESIAPVPHVFGRTDRAATPA